MASSSSEQLSTPDASPAPPAHARETLSCVSLAAELRAATGISPARCYQCGKCTAGCPMADEMPHKIHQIMRAVQWGARAFVLADESIWLCLGCETCSARCPNQVEPARLIDALRELAAKDEAASAAVPRRLGAFHQAFLKQIAQHGRVFEFGLVAAYKMKTGRLFDDLTSAPGMLARGKLALTPRTIAGVADIRRIFAACTTDVGAP